MLMKIKWVFKFVKCLEELNRIGICVGMLTQSSWHSKVEVLSEIKLRQLTQIQTVSKLLISV